MRTVLLLRHAKSSWDDADLADHERPLAKRGTKDAPAIGRFMAASGMVPDLVLCSNAVRTRATLTLVLPELGEPKPHIVYDPALYMAEPAAIMARVAQVDADQRNLLVVAHNPGLHALALELCGDGKAGDLASLAIKFPTCGLAVIDLPAASWARIPAGSGKLRLFTSPKQL